MDKIKNWKTSTIEWLDLKWCCKTTSNICTLEEPGKWYSNVLCAGKIIPFTEQCHDDYDTTPTCNFHPKDNNRNYGSYGISHIDICNNNKLVLTNISTNHKKGL